MSKSVGASSEFQKHQEILRKLNIENENLKDLLEAAQQNAEVFIKDMLRVLEKGEDQSSDDEAIDDLRLKAIRKKKASISK